MWISEERVLRPFWSKMLETNKTGRPALVLHSVLGDSDYPNACICFPSHNKPLPANRGLGGTWLFFWIEKRPPPLHLLRAIHPRELCYGEISRFPIKLLAGRIKRVIRASIGRN